MELNNLDSSDMNLPALLLNALLDFDSALS